MKEFLTDHATILQIVGGSLALIAALVGLFKKDTVKMNSNKLTGFGWLSLIIIVVGTTVSATSKYFEFKDTKEASRKKDSIINYQNTVLGAIKIQQEEEAAFNNPLWPLTVKYSLA